MLRNLIALDFKKTVFGFGIILPSKVWNIPFRGIMPKSPSSGYQPGLAEYLSSLVSRYGSRTENPDTGGL